MNREYYYQNTMYDSHTCIEDAKDIYFKQLKRDCFDCKQSGVTKDDELWCSLHQKIVHEGETCEEYDC